MSVELHEQAGGKILEVALTGKLTKEDYRHFVPEVERLIKKHGKLRMFVKMHDFHGWTGAALWQDVEFDFKHIGDIERLALVGEKTWEHGMAVFCKPFTTATVTYFDTKDANEAEVWLNEGLPVEAEKSASRSSASTT
jgi:hypothetical protein